LGGVDKWIKDYEEDAEIKEEVTFRLVEGYNKVDYANMENFIMK